MEKETVSQVRDFGARITENVERVIVGKADIVELTIIALPREGRVLLENMPSSNDLLP